MMKESKIQLDSFIQMIATVAKLIPNLSIIVRPHPGEDLQIYYQNLSKKLNINNQIFFTGPRVDVNDFYTISWCLRW